MNTTTFTTLIDRYKRKLKERGIGDETYKWVWMSNFKGRPDLDAPDFQSEVRQFRTNLMYPMSGAVMTRLAAERPDAFRNLLRDLFDESVGLQERVSAYITRAEELYRIIRTNNTHSQQEERTVSVLLAARYPETYPIYKEKLYQKLCNQLGRSLSKPGFKYVDYIGLVKEFVDDHIRQDAELISLVKSQLPSDAYEDPNFLILAQDILHQNYEGEASNRETAVDPTKPRVWLMSAGANASIWPSFKQDGVARLNQEFGIDLAMFKTHDDLRVQIAGQSTERQKNRILALWEFAHVMKPGDFIIVKKGLKTYIGVGKVLSGYRFDSFRKDYPHVRDVEWFKEGSWQEDSQQIVTKTLTDITKYPDYVRKLKEQIGFGTDEKALKTQPIMDSNSSFWWLNANPKYWDLSEHAVGSLQTYTTYAQTGNKRRIYKYFEALKPGDQIIGYETTPRKRVVARLVVTQGIHRDDEDQEVIEFRVDAFYVNRPTWEELQSESALAKAEVFENNQGSLFKLTKAEFEHIESLAIGTTKPRDPYSLAHATSDSFLDPAWLKDTLELWTMKKNLVLQGPPGTGKTFVAKRLAWLLMGEKDESRLHMVQFHPSYSYEDFIEGYRPDGNGGFKLATGHFLAFCKRAASDPDRKYVFVIDEINRGNLSKVFGEVMMGIEADKRGETLRLQYSSDRPFTIPPNVHLIGTMNTADRSLALVDYALRRRFAFQTVEPEFGDRFVAFMKSKKVSPELITRITTTMARVNHAIEHDPSLGKGYFVGHSYFCSPPADAHEAWLNRIWEYEVLPLMEEYWFDQSEKATEMKKVLGVA